MKKISTKGRYGLRFMLDLAMCDAGQPTPLREIAERQGLSQKYLWQVIAPLKAGGLIRSLAGANGGYELAQPPEAITALAVIRCLEGDVKLAPCDDETEKLCDRFHMCALQPFWQGLENVLETYLASITLAMLAEQQRDINEKMTPSFCI